MIHARRALFALCVATSAAGAGCNSRPEMRGIAPRAAQPFLGPIPLSFRNTADRPAFEAAATAAASRYVDSGGALALAPGAGLPLAPPPGAAAGGLTELDACGNLKSLMGSFLTQAELTAQAQPGAQALLDPATLAGKSCDAALAAAGVAFAEVVTALQAQAADLGRQGVAADACTGFADEPQLSPRAAAGFVLPRAAGGGAALDEQTWPMFSASFEGGFDGTSLALRGETEADAKQAVDDGEREVYHWTAIASLANPALASTVSEKAEQLIVSERKGGGGAHETHLARLVTMTLASGKVPAADETSEFAYYVDGALARQWTVTMHVQAAPGGGLDVDLTTAAHAAPSTAKSAKLVLRQAPGAAGCEARLR